MANAKYHYYVLVFTNNGPVYVTRIHHVEEWAEFERLEKPFEMSKGMAEDLVLGLNLNGNSSVMVASRWEIENQPYYYKEFSCSFNKLTE